MPLNAIEVLLKQEIGLHSATVGSQTVQHAIESRMRECGIEELEDYHQIIQYSRTELDALIDTVVVPETWFFRDVSPFLAFSTWLDRHKRRFTPAAPLRVLSVPCSTGEEPYTLAMCLTDAGIDPDCAHIDAVDISSANLETARRAEFGRNSFRSSDLSFRNRHFTQSGQRFRLNQAVRDRVTFSRANILAPSALIGRDLYHAIFCRNLLIYFDRTTQHAVIDTLCEKLSEEGLLFLGHSETSLLSGRPFEAMDYPSCFGFVHRREGSPASAEQPAARKARPGRSKQRTFDTRRSVAQPSSKPVFSEDAPATPVEASVPVSIETAFRLADEGHLDEAATLCETLLRQDACHADAHYLLGVIREASGNFTDAEQLFRKTLFLRPDHVAAMSHLCAVFERLGKHQEAQRFRDRVERVQTASSGTDR